MKTRWGSGLMKLPKSLESILTIAVFRTRLLLRQKLGWLSLLIGVGVIMLSQVMAQASFINPLKIFWDFALGANFLIQVVLAIYLSSQLLKDESTNRSLHLLLSSGLSRLSWFLGNGLGIFITLCFMNFSWLVFSFLSSRLFFESWGNPMIQLQCQWLVMMEILIVIFLTFLLSLIVRPLIALVAAFSSLALLHSLDSLQRIFTDPESGRHTQEYGLRSVIWLVRLLPPLDWFDLRSFVGYRDAFATSFIFQMSLISLLWTFLIVVVAKYRFDRMDL